MCTECLGLGTDVKNRQGVTEALICCSQCKTYAHPSCLDLLEHLTHSVIKVSFNRDILPAKVDNFMNFNIAFVNGAAKLDMDH